MDPFNQTFTLQGPDGQGIPLWLPEVDGLLRRVTATSINYGTQVGASIVMLAVVLALTSRARFARASTLIHVASLAVSSVRCMLLALYFTSSYLELYTFVSGDTSRVPRSDTSTSAVASFLAAPQLLLVEAALMLQAWALVRMWPAGRRAALVAASALLVVPAVVFRIFRVVQYMRATLGDWLPSPYVWLQQCDLAFSTATVFWFCLVFITRLVMHMWTCRSILPPVAHLSSMEVLAMTNGVLMLVPVIFAAMEFGNFGNFESGSLTLTSVVIVLPLGTIIAQHRTDEAGRRPSRGQASPGGSGASGYNRTSDTAASNSNSSSKKRFFGSWSHASDSTALVSGGLTTKVKIQGGGNGDSGSSDSIAARGRNKDKDYADDVEQELQRIDAVDNGMDNSKRVWVGHEIEIRQDMV